MNLLIFVHLEPSSGSDILGKPEIYADRSLVSMFGLKYLCDIKV